MKSWSRRRSYRYRAAIALQNHSDIAQSCTVIVPIPQHTSHQVPFEDPQSSCKISFEVEPVHSFRYAVWHTEISAGEQQECIVTCPVRIAPQRAQLSRIDVPLRNGKAVEKEVEALASKLEKGLRRTDSYIRAVYEYCATQLTYGDPIRGLYTPLDALTRERVDCGGFSMLALSLLHARGISARLVTGFLTNARHDPMHVWIEIRLPDGNWLPADIATDHLFRIGRDRTKSGRLGFVGSDHLTVSWGNDLTFDRDGHPVSVPLFQHPFLALQDQDNRISIESQVTISEYAPDFH